MVAACPRHIRLQSPPSRCARHPRRCREPLSEMDFDSWKITIVFRDEPGQSNMSDRHDARYDDLTTLLFGELAYTFDANLQIVQQPPSERSKLLPRFSNRNMTRAS